MICPDCHTPNPGEDSCPTCADRTVKNRRAAGATLANRTPDWPPKAPPKALPETPAPEIGGYSILGKLGEGGMGAVFLAKDDMLGRQVAIKVITGGEDEIANARFLREARTMASAEHPNIVRVLSFGTTGDSKPYIVMELVDGESLSARIARDGRLEVDEALWIVRQVVEALAASWKKGIIHRDIKPSNILLDKQGNVRVADFGLAKPVRSEDDELTATGLVVGSPFYIAPEQATAQETDFRADIYSLGVVLFELLSGERPFAGKNAFSIVSKHISAPLPKLREKRPELSGAAVAIVEKMTSKDPANRYGSYALLLRDLDRALAGDASLTSMNPAVAAPAVAAQGPSSAFTMWMVGAVVVVLLIAVGVKIGASRAAADRQRAEAEAAAKLAAQKPPESKINVNALKPGAEAPAQAVAPAQVVLQPIYIQQQSPAQAPMAQQPLSQTIDQLAAEHAAMQQQPQQPVMQQQPQRMPPPPPPGAPFPPPPGGGPGQGGPGPGGPGRPPG